MPALAITTSSPPNVATPCATAASMSSNFVTLPTIDVAWPAPSSASSAASGSRARSTRTNFAPLPTRPRAVSAPTPRAPPVIRTTCPFSFFMNATVPSTAPDRAHDRGGELGEAVRRVGRRVAEHQLGALLAEGDEQAGEELGVEALRAAAAGDALLGDR